MIWNGDNSSLLFSQTIPVAAGGSGLATNYLLSDPFSFTLNAGNTYYFGVVGSTDVSIGGHTPVTSTTMNGLTSLASGQAYYTLSGGSPAFQAYETDPASEVSMGLRLFARWCSHRNRRSSCPPACCLPVHSLCGVAGIVVRRFSSHCRIGP